MRNGEGNWIYSWPYALLQIALALRERGGRLKGVEVGSGGGWRWQPPELTGGWSLSLSVADGFVLAPTAASQHESFVADMDMIKYCGPSRG